MEAKLKALKVVDLKDILSRAHVSVTGKANKADLIAKILSSPNAIAVFEGNAGTPAAGSLDETPKPTQVDTEPETPPTPLDDDAASLPPVSDQTEPLAPTPSAPNASHKPEAKSTVTTGTVPSGGADTTHEDEELAKRRARAARFNIPLVETTKPEPTKRTVKRNDDPERLEARAKRFGVQANGNTKSNSPPSRGNKRAAPVEDNVDPVELERRKKRAERFGTALPATKA